MKVYPKCLDCKFFTPNGGDGPGFYYCKAFPNQEVRTAEELRERKNNGITDDPKGIPDDILFGKNDHYTPVEGQVLPYLNNPVKG